MSKTISRISPPPLSVSAPALPGDRQPFRAQESDDCAQPAQTQAATQTGRNDEVSTPTFLVIRYLIAQDCCEAPLCHARSPQYTLPLYQSGGRNDEYIITPTFAAALEEKGDIEHDNRLSPRASKSKKPPFKRLHHGVDNSLKPRESLGIREDALTEKRAINPAFRCSNAAERRCHRLYRSSAGRQQPMHDMIGIKQWNPEPPQGRRCGALTHADRAGEAKNNQRAGAKVARIAARSPWVTCTGVPNQASNPGRP